MKWTPTLTDTDLVLRYDGRVGVLVNAGAAARVPSAADREHEVVAVRVGEGPVLPVGGVPGALEAQRQHAVFVRDGRVLHALDGVSSRR